MSPKQFNAKLEKLIKESDLHFMEVIDCLNHHIELARLLAARDFIEFSMNKDNGGSDEQTS